MTRSYPQAPNFTKAIPPGDNMERSVCAACGFVDYQNPKIVTGSVAVWEQKILLCKRAIEPRKGYWTLPAGFLENDETLAEGALRETLEETRAQLINASMYRVLSVVDTNQVHIFFKADLPTPDFDVTPESSSVELFTFEQIPWRQLAFPTVARALRDFVQEHSQGAFTIESADVTRSDWSDLDR